MSAGPCLGDVVAALVDGELDHAGRESAQRHLAHCAGCRREVEGQRRLKARLTGLAEEPAAGMDPLQARLLRIAQDAPAPAGRPHRPGPLEPGTRRPGSREPGRRGSARSGTGRSGRGRRPGRRGVLAGTSVVALGLAAAFALGSPAPQQPTTPLDPAGDVFVAEFVSTTGDAVPARPTPGGVGSPR